MYLSRAVSVSLAFAAFAAARAQDAPYVATSAEITLGCPHPNVISVVIGHDDEVAYQAVMKPEKGFFEVARTRKFDASNTYARAYFGTKSTNCEKSKDERRGDDFVGTFIFACRAEKARTLTISAPAVYVSYVRVMNDVPPCWQGAHFRDEPREVRAVVFSAEKVRLQLAQQKPDPKAPGLLVYDREVIAHPEKKVDPVELNRDKVIAALASQRNRELMKTYSTNSPNSRDDDQKKLTNAGLTVLRLSLKDQQ